MPKHLFTIPYGTTLPDPAGLPEGYPFRLDPDNVLYTITGGVFVALAGGGTGGGGGTGDGFHDDFVRANVALAGNNGWFKSVGHAGDVADWAIVSNEVVVPTGSTVDFGNHPLLHVRDSADPDVIDVTVTVRRNSNAGNSGVCIASDDAGENMLWLYYDGSDHTSAGAQPQIMEGDSGTASGFDTDYGTWADFTDNVTEMAIRCVFTVSTGILQVYQGATLCYDWDVNAALTAFHGTPTSYPDLATQPNSGIIGNAGENVDTVLDFLSV